jgi:hypothetical protein
VGHIDCGFDVWGTFIVVSQLYMWGCLLFGGVEVGPVMGRSKQEGDVCCGSVSGCRRCVEGAGGDRGVLTCVDGGSMMGRCIGSAAGGVEVSVDVSGAWGPCGGGELVCGCGAGV